MMRSVSIRAQVRCKIVQSISIESATANAESRGYKFLLAAVRSLLFYATSRAIIINGGYVFCEKSQINAKRVIFIINVSAMRAIIGLESSTRAKRVFHLVDVKNTSLHDLPLAFRRSFFSIEGRCDFIFFFFFFFFFLFLPPYHGDPQLRALEKILSRSLHSARTS
jgi:hypothetical protein